MVRVYLFAMAIAFLFSGAEAAEESDIVVYKDSKGSLTQQSRKNLPLLMRKASENGSISVWVLFNIPFEANPNYRTSDVVAEEAAAKEAAIAKTIMPLVEKELAFEVDYSEMHYVDYNALNEAPGILLRLTAAGLKKLVQVEEVRHIVYLSGEH